MEEQKPAADQPVQQVPQTSKGTNGISVAALIASFFLPLIGLILGLIGLSQAKKENSSKGVAVAAIIISSLWFVLILVLVTIGVIAGIMSDSKNDEDNNNGSSSSVIDSNTKSVQGVAANYTLRVDKDFDNLTSELGNADADIVYGNESSEVYAMVIVESDVDFEDGLTVAEYASLAIDSTLPNLGTDAQVTELGVDAPSNPHDYTVRDYKVSGSYGGVKVSYLFRFTKVDNNFYQVISWTLQSRYDQKVSEMKDIVSSFSVN